MSFRVCSVIVFKNYLKKKKENKKKPKTSLFVLKTWKIHKILNSKNKNNFQKALMCF